MPTLVTRVDVTPEAAEVLRSLRGTHGPLMFHQSGGCCDGSSPMCYPAGDFVTGDADVQLGNLDIESSELVAVWIGRKQFGAWQHTHLTIDVVPGRGSGFSLESPLGVRFITRSRLFTDEESEALVSRPG